MILRQTFVLRTNRKSTTLKFKHVLAPTLLFGAEKKVLIPILKSSFHDRWFLIYHVSTRKIVSYIIFQCNPSTPLPKSGHVCDQWNAYSYLFQQKRVLSKFMRQVQACHLAKLCSGYYCKKPAGFNAFQLTLQPWRGPASKMNYWHSRGLHLTPRTMI